MEVNRSHRVTATPGCHCTLLRKATRRLSRLYDVAVAPSGLKTTQAAILAEIARSQPCPVGELAEKMVMDSGALAHTLKPLERDGYIAVAVDEKDRRNRLISLTELGRQKKDETQILLAQAQRGFEAAVGPGGWEALNASLHLLISDEFMDNFQAALPQAR
jgi:DNA-binding MarR family transcriptional regulator